MEINIVVLNVNDADAIIVHLIKDKKHLVMLIDAGHTNDAGEIIKELTPVLTIAGKDAPDVMICSHFDTDHICGLIGVLQTYKEKVKQFFIHRTTEVLTKADSVEKSAILPSEDDLVIGGNDFMDYQEDPYLTAILEGIKQEKQLIALIDGYHIDSIEPTAGSWNLSDWPEVEIIGPTKAYYKDLFPAHFTTNAFIQQELVELKEDLDQAAPTVNKDICTALDEVKRTPLSHANLNSTIVKITIVDKVFLFSADAGITSFYNVPDYKKQLKDVFWLKVPHHASANNINSELIKLMKPEIAVISGKRHVSPLVAGCLAQHCPQVDITSVVQAHLRYSF
jgi:beta-lactamase superfamily II metal-dependent hydrolase